MVPSTVGLPDRMDEFSVIIVSSDAFSEDERGDFDTFEEAYAAFEEAMVFIDTLTSTVDDYPFELDVVQLLDSNRSILVIWQRPPYRTRQLFNGWAQRKMGHDKHPNYDRTHFVRLRVHGDNEIGIDRWGKRIAPTTPSGST